MDGAGGDTVRFDFFGDCLNGDYSGKVSIGDCHADTARWQALRGRRARVAQAQLPVRLRQST